VDSLDSSLKQVHLLYTYAISLARYDISYEIRDRARLLKNVHLSPLCEAALHTSKPVPRMETFGERGAKWTLGSMAQVIMKDVQGTMKLPEWGSEIPEKGVRDAPEPSHITAVVPSAPTSVVSSVREEKKKEKKVWKDLDKFYASESESEGSEEEESEEEESDEATEEDEGAEKSEESEEEESEEESDEDNPEQQLTSRWR
jgi:AP-3 complex subunit beta